MSNKWKDYSLVGKRNAQAVESGLAGADWYQCPVPRKEMKALMQRRDGPALRDTLIWFCARYRATQSGSRVSHKVDELNLVYFFSTYE
jgi:hypothetical protein